MKEVFLLSGISSTLLFLWTRTCHLDRGFGLTGPRPHGSTAFPAKEQAWRRSLSQNSRTCQCFISKPGATWYITILNSSWSAVRHTGITAGTLNPNAYTLSPEVPRTCLPPSTRPTAAITSCARRLLLRGPEAATLAAIQISSSKSSSFP